MPIDPWSRGALIGLRRTCSRCDAMHTIGEGKEKRRCLRARPGQRTTMASASGSFRLLFAREDSPRLLFARVAPLPRLSASPGLPCIVPSSYVATYASFRLPSLRFASSSRLLPCPATQHLPRTAKSNLPLIPTRWEITLHTYVFATRFRLEYL